MIKDEELKIKGSLKVVEDNLKWRKFISSS